VLARDRPTLAGELRLDAVLVPALLVAHVAALYWVLRRYAVGVGGDLLVVDSAWQPPLGVWPVLSLYAGGLVVTVLLLRALSPPRTGVTPA
jgi:hypothetical protein